MTRIFFTGRLKIGKDFCAQQAGAKILGFADPLYDIATQFFGTADKNLPGLRSFLQSVGQWGRGEISEQYPLTPTRAMFSAWIRAAGHKLMGDKWGIDWSAYGNDQNLWLNSLVSRSEAVADASVIAATNVRFSNEFEALRMAGWQHYHVMCSMSTYTARLRAGGMTMESPELRDLSEKLAARMDTNVQASLRKAPQGPKLRVIWSDDKVAAPSPRFLTVPEFVVRVTDPPATVATSAPMAAPAAVPSAVPTAPAPAQTKRFDPGQSRGNPHPNVGRMTEADASNLDRMVGLEAAELQIGIEDQNSRLQHMVEMGR